MKAGKGMQTQGWGISMGDFLQKMELVKWVRKDRTNKSKQRKGVGNVWIRNTKEYFVFKR